MSSKDFNVEIKRIAHVGNQLSSVAIRSLKITHGASSKVERRMLNQAIGYCFIVQAESYLELNFELLEMKQRELFKVGSGVFLFDISEIGVGQVFKKCSITSTETMDVLLNIDLRIEENLENMAYSDDDGSFIQPISPSRTSSPSEPHPKSSSSVVISENPVKNRKIRHSHFKINSDENNFRIVNQVSHNSSKILENIKIDMKEPLHKITFTDGEGFIAFVEFNSNPTPDELKKIQIKIPETCSKLSASLQCTDGECYDSVLKFPKLQESESLRLNSFIFNQSQEDKGKLSFNFRKEEARQKSTIEKEAIGEEGFNPPSHKNADLKAENGSVWRNLFFPPKEDPLERKPVLKKLIPEKRCHISGIVNQSFLPQIRRVSCGTQKSNISQLSQLSQLSHSKKEKFKNSFAEIKPVERMITLPVEMMKNHSVIEIKEVVIVFYSQYLVSNNIKVDKDAIRGKSLQIYTNFKNIYRSEPALGSQKLEWELQDCDLQINQFEKLTLEVSYDKDRTIIGDFVVSFNQLKYNYSNTAIYSGYITKNAMPIAKISINYELADRQESSRRRRNNSVTKSNRVRSKTSRKPSLFIENLEDIDSGTCSPKRHNRHYCETIHEKGRRRESGGKRKKRKIFI